MSETIYMEERKERIENNYINAGTKWEDIRTEKKTKK